MGYPVAQIDIARSVKTQQVVDRQVPMAENEVVNGFLFEYFKRMPDQPLPLWSQKLFFTGQLAAAAGDKLHQSQAGIGVNPGKQPLSCPVGKNALDQFVSVIAGSQAVTVSDVKAF